MTVSFRIPESVGAVVGSSTHLPLCPWQWAVKAPAALLSLATAESGARPAQSWLYHENQAEQNMFCEFEALIAYPLLLVHEALEAGASGAPLPGRWDGDSRVPAELLLLRPIPQALDVPLKPFYPV